MTTNNERGLSSPTASSCATSPRSGGSRRRSGARSCWNSSLRNASLSQHAPSRPGGCRRDEQAGDRAAPPLPPRRAARADPRGAWTGAVAYCSESCVTPKPRSPGSRRKRLTAKRSRPEMAPQRLEKIESAPGNGMGSEASNLQDLVRGRAADRARLRPTSRESYEVAEKGAQDLKSLDAELKSAPPFLQANARSIPSACDGPARA
jgi:hypothetical protein